MVLFGVSIKSHTSKTYSKLHKKKGKLEPAVAKRGMNICVAEAILSCFSLERMRKLIHRMCEHMHELSFFTQV